MGRRDDVSLTYNDAVIARYAAAAPLLQRLRRLNGRLKPETLRALRARALDGDIEGATDELLAVLIEQDERKGDRP